MKKNIWLVMIRWIGGSPKRLIIAIFAAIVIVILMHVFLGKAIQTSKTGLDAMLFGDLSCQLICGFQPAQQTILITDDELCHMKTPTSIGQFSDNGCISECNRHGVVTDIWYAISRSSVMMRLDTKPLCSMDHHDSGQNK